MPISQSARRPCRLGRRGGGPHVLESAGAGLRRDGHTEVAYPQVPCAQANRQLQSPQYKNQPSRMRSSSSSRTRTSEGKGGCTSSVRKMLSGLMSRCIFPSHGCVAAPTRHPTPVQPRSSAPAQKAKAGRGNVRTLRGGNSRSRRPRSRKARRSPFRRCLEWRIGVSEGNGRGCAPPGVGVVMRLPREPYICTYRHPPTATPEVPNDVSCAPISTTVRTSQGRRGRARSGTACGSS